MITAAKKSSERLRSLRNDLLLFSGLVLVILGMAVSGLAVYELGSDPAFVAVFKGDFTTVPGRTSLNHGNWLFLGHVIQNLYKTNPDFDWYGGAVVILSAFSVFVYAKLIQVFWMRGWRAQFVFLLFMAPFFLENLFLLEFTRVGFNLSYLGLSALLVSAICYEDPKIQNLAYSGVIAFVLGALIRTQPALLSFFVATPVALLLVFNRTARPAVTVNRMVIPFLFCVFLIGFSSFRWDESFDKTPEYSGYVISLYDIEFPKEQLYLASVQDSLVLDMVLDQQFLNDPAIINRDFFERIGVPYTENKIHSFRSMLSNRHRYMDKLNLVGLKFLQNHLGWCLTFASAFVLTLFAGLVNRDIPHTVGTLLLFLFHTLVYFSISAFLKMEHRVFVPLLVAFVLSFVLHSTSLRKSAFNIYSVSIAIALLMALGYILEVPRFGQRYQNRRVSAEFVERVIQEIHRLGFPVVFMDHLVNRIYGHPFHGSPLAKEFSYPTINNYGFFTDPNYAPRMKQLTGGEDLEGYLEYIERNEQSCLFVSRNLEAMTQFTSYLNLFYDHRFVVRPVVEDFREVLDSDYKDCEPVGVFQLIEAD